MLRIGNKVLIRDDCEDYSVHRFTNNFYVGKIVTIKWLFGDNNDFEVIEDKSGFTWCSDMIKKVIVE